MKPHTIQIIALIIQLVAVAWQMVLYVRAKKKYEAITKIMADRARLIFEIEQLSHRDKDEDAREMN